MDQAGARHPAVPTEHRVTSGRRVDEVETDAEARVDHLRFGAPGHGHGPRPTEPAAVEAPGGG